MRGNEEVRTELGRLTSQPVEISRAHLDKLVKLKETAVCGTFMSILNANQLNSRTIDNVIDFNKFLELADNNCDLALAELLRNFKLGQHIKAEFIPVLVARALRAGSYETAVALFTTHADFKDGLYCYSRNANLQFVKGAPLLCAALVGRNTKAIDFLLSQYGDMTFRNVFFGANREASNNLYALIEVISQLLTQDPRNCTPVKWREEMMDGPQAVVYFLTKISTFVSEIVNTLLASRPNFQTDYIAEQWYDHPSTHCLAYFATQSDFKATIIRTAFDKEDSPLLLAIHKKGLLSSEESARFLDLVIARRDYNGFVYWFNIIKSKDKLNSAFLQNQTMTLLDGILDAKYNRRINVTETDRQELDTRFLRMVGMLLESGATPNTQCDKKPLDYAIMATDLSLLLAFLRKGAIVSDRQITECQNGNFKTILKMAYDNMRLIEENAALKKQLGPAARPVTNALATLIAANRSPVAAATPAAAANGNSASQQEDHSVRP